MKGTILTIKHPPTIMCMGKVIQLLVDEHGNRRGNPDEINEIGGLCGEIEHVWTQLEECDSEIASKNPDEKLTNPSDSDISEHSHGINITVRTQKPKDPEKKSDTKLCDNCENKDGCTQEMIEYHPYCWLPKNTDCPMCGGVEIDHGTYSKCEDCGHEDRM